MPAPPSIDFDETKVVEVEQDKNIRRTVSMKKPKPLRPASIPKVGEKRYDDTSTKVKNDEKNNLEHVKEQMDTVDDLKQSVITSMQLNSEILKDGDALEKNNAESENVITRAGSMKKPKPPRPLSHPPPRPDAPSPTQIRKEIIEESPEIEGKENEKQLKKKPPRPGTIPSPVQTKKEIVSDISENRSQENPPMLEALSPIQTRKNLDEETLESAQEPESDENTEEVAKVPSPAVGKKEIVDEVLGTARKAEGTDTEEGLGKLSRPKIPSSVQTKKDIPKDAQETAMEEESNEEVTDKPARPKLPSPAQARKDITEVTQEIAKEEESKEEITKKPPRPKLPSPAQARKDITEVTREIAKEEQSKEEMTHKPPRRKLPSPAQARKDITKVTQEIAKEADSSEEMTKKPLRSKLPSPSLDRKDIPEDTPETLKENGDTASEEVTEEVTKKTSPLSEVVSPAPARKNVSEHDNIENDDIDNLDQQRVDEKGLETQAPIAESTSDHGVQNQKKTFAAEKKIKPPRPTAPLPVTHKKKPETETVKTESDKIKPARPKIPSPQNDVKWDSAKQPEEDVLSNKDKQMNFDPPIALVTSSPVRKQNTKPQVMDELKPCAVAVYDFAASSPDELSFEAGDEVELLKRIDSDWFQGRIGTRKGYFPQSFVEIIWDLPEDKSELQEVNSSYAEAIYDFEGMGSDKLSFKTGDKIISPTKIDDEWMKGKLGGKSGIFPLSFVVMSEDSELTSVFEKTYINDSIQGPRCRALFDYSCETEEDLSFKTGDVIKLIEKVDNEWLNGEIGNKQGMFPAAFVSIIEDLPSKTDNMSPSHVSAVHKECVKAAYDYPSDAPDDLSFKQGDVITVISQLNSDWWRGELNGKTGVFPAAFLEFIPKDLPLDEPTQLTETDSKTLTVENNECGTTKETKVNKPHEKGLVLYDFIGESEGELSIKPGDIVTILRRIDNDWMEGELVGKRGIFPACFVDVVDPVISQEAEEKADSKTPAEDVSPRAEAVFDFSGEEPDELSFKLLLAQTTETKQYILHQLKTEIKQHSPPAQN